MVMPGRMFLTRRREALVPGPIPGPGPIPLINALYGMGSKQLPTGTLSGPIESFTIHGNCTLTYTATYQTALGGLQHILALYRNGIELGRVTGQNVSTFVGQLQIDITASTGDVIEVWGLSLGDNTALTSVVISGDVYVEGLVTSHDYWNYGTDNPSWMSAGVSEYNGYGYKSGMESGWNPRHLKYDILNDSWSTLTNMNIPRDGSTSNIIGNKIYAIGGYTMGMMDEMDFTLFNSNEEYNISTDTWTTKAPMSEAKYMHATSVCNGKIYVFGGATNSGYSNKVEIYNPSTNSWSFGTDIPSTLVAAAAVAYGNTIYVMGGASTTVRTYNTVTNVWGLAANMPYAVYGAGAVILGNKIYVGLGNIQVYDIPTNTWTSGYASSPRGAYDKLDFIYNSKIYLLGSYGTQIYTI